MVVATIRTLKSVMAGETANFAGSNLFQIEHPDDASIRAIYSKGDTDTDPLILVADAGNEGMLPDRLRKSRDVAYHRMRSFVERAKTLPVTLPRGWHQYKYRNLIGFFALPEASGEPYRWIAEINASGSADVVFWALTDTDQQQVLERYQPDQRLHKATSDFWRDNRLTGLAAMTGPPQSSMGLDVTLSTPPMLGVAKTYTYGEWISQLTDRQREFFDAPTDRSVRLRGPAGSGKTLTLCLKAVREAQASRTAGKPIQVLFVTHSWSLAGQVDELITQLSEYGRLDEVNVLPLVSVAQDTLPEGMVPADLDIIGDDSLSGKTVQLEELEEVVTEFRSGDWITFRAQCSAEFASRIDSIERGVVRGLAWDLLIEFGCVLGADGIFPGVNAEKRYLKLPRAPWMMPLATNGDKRAVYAIYVRYWEELQARHLLTSDQLLNDFLNYLEGFAWNHRRLTEGYDLIFADEFHLFNTLERQTLRYLSRDVSSYPRIFMAMDPRQSPWDVFFGGDDAQGIAGSSEEDDFDGLRTVDIPTVHRSSPQVLDLIKHIHLEYANLNLDEDWDYQISEVESLAAPGPKPSLFISGTFGGEEAEISRAIISAYSQAAGSGTHLALAFVDEDAYRRYAQMIRSLGTSGKYRIIEITSRDDVGLLRYHKRGIVVGPAEYLAGLQFDTVLVAGLPELADNVPNQGVRRRGALSLLYLAVSRASRDVRIFANYDHGGIPEVLVRAAGKGILGIFKK